MPNPEPTKLPTAAVVEDEERKHILDQGPPEEEFWEKYSRHLEFPLSTVGSILLHVLVGAFIVFVLFRLANQNVDRGAVPMKLVEPGGFDDEGEGSAGSGGNENPLTEGNSNPFQKSMNEVLPVEKMPEAIANIKDLMKALDEGDVPVSAQAAAAFNSVDDELKKKLLGSKRGSGNEAGRGDDGSKGTGPGGTGSDSTRARTMRWVLRFRTASGEDYLQQLSAMGGTIVVPVPPENKEYMYFPNPKDPSSGHMATAADTRTVANQIKFGDSRPDSVAGVAGALRLNFKPKSFWAIFPKNIEEELDRKERGYRNRRPEDIEETFFRITVTGGNVTIVVDDQKAKR